MAAKAKPVNQRNLMQELNQEIKDGALKQAYLFYGEEAYLVRSFKEKFLTAMMQGADQMNLNRYVGKDVSVPQIIDMAETMPFFADHRVILMENTGLFKSGGDELAAYFNDGISDGTFFLITEQDVDKRSKVFKALEKRGKAIEFGPQDEEMLQKWILSLLKNAGGLNITPSTMNYLLQCTGNNMQNIDNEVAKLTAYCMKKGEVTIEDINAICTQQVTSQIFKMTDAMAAGDRMKAMNYYYDMIELQEEPIKILAMITRHFNLLMQARDITARGGNERVVAEQMGVSPFQAGLYLRQSRAFPLPWLKRAFRECVDVDYRIKSGLIDRYLGVETLLLKYSGGSRGTA